MTLALLLTAVTGAWAITDPNSVYWYNQTWKGWAENVTTHTVGDITITCSGNAKAYESTSSNEPLALQAGANDAITFTSNGKPFASVAIMTDDGLNVAGWTYNSSTLSYEWSGEPTTSVTLSGCDIKADVITFTFGTAEAPVTVEPGSSANTWTFTMPGSDVVLTPIYAAATVYGADGQTEKMAYETLKEAFANVQDGDVIKLDWNVTLTETLETPTIDGGVKFTLDFNGYTINGGTTYIIQLKNAGDQLTFTDSSDDQLGGLIAKELNTKAGSKFVFDAGRYNISGTTAEIMNGLCANTSNPLSLAEGKEFIDLEGGAEANDGFTLSVGFKTFELAIGAGKFATFYAEQNVTVVEGTNISFYTIDAVDQAHTTATVAQYNSPVVPGNFPILVYNGSDNDQNVKLKVTTDPSTITAKMQSGAFQGTADDREFTADDMAAKDYYVLSGGSAFAPVKGKGTIAAHKCWLEFAKNNGNARSFKIVFDNGEATGVNEVIEVNEVSDDTLYDLNGRKLNGEPTRKGVYIQNGRKVVIK